MKKVKVAFFAEILSEEFDGASRTMFQLLKRIDPDRFEFMFICGTGPEQIDGFECMRIPTMALPLNSTYAMAIPALAQNRIKERLQRFKPDVVHIATPSLLGNFALRYAVLNHIPVISIYHTHFVSYVKYYLKHVPFLVNKVRQLIAGSQKNLYNQCEKIYVPSESIKNELSEMGIEPFRMKMWKRGINTNLFNPSKRDVALMRSLTGNSFPTILFASRLVWEKNLETLFRIYDLIQYKKLKVNLVIAGDGVARKAAKQRMSNAIFTRQLDHQLLSVLYASADVFLFPSISETYGNVVLEAMASGLPCVIADGGGSKDFIEQGTTGFKCRPCDELDYVEKIEVLLSNRELHRQFANEGIKFSEKSCWAALADVYFDDLMSLAQPQYV